MMMGENKIKILLGSSNGENILIEVDKNDKLEVLKKTINGCNYQKNLMYQCIVLDETKTFDECNLTNYALVKSVSILCGGMQIFAKLIGNDKKVTFEVSPTETILDVKKKIFDKLQLSPEKQKLVYQSSILEDDKTVVSYGISDSGLITVIEKVTDGFQILVKSMDGQTVKIIVQDEDTILRMKEKIEVKHKLPPKQQKIVFEGHILEEEKTVKECGIKKDNVINLVAVLRGGFNKENNNAIYKQKDILDYFHCL